MSPVRNGPLWALLTLGALLVACSDAPAGDGDAGADPLDSSADTPDAIAPPIDSGTPPDGGRDGDGDGIATDVDCDDADPDVGSTSTRSCTSACGTGLERCTDGAWAACDAPTDCACTSIGMTRTVSCGRCGLASQTCQTDMTWSIPTACLGESECFEGDIEREMEMCGERARICDDTCHWREWTEVAPPGECEAGAVMATAAGCLEGEARELTCSATCAWEETAPCSARCTRVAAPSRTGADPVCIPAGSFYLGLDTPDPYTPRPERRVVLSEYYIDRLPVTKARYEMCRAAGACPDPDSTYQAEYDSGPSDAMPVGLTVAAVEGFCTWDGGALQTEFQYEKAARGAVPDRRMHSWGTEPADTCTVHPGASCPGNVFSYSSFPAAVSPYGVRLLGSLTEWTSTPEPESHENYSWIPDGAVDPVPPPSADRIVRGWPWWSSGSAFPTPYSALARYGRGSPGRIAFRCVY